MTQEKFTGDQKNLNYFLASFDKKITQVLLPRVPHCIGTVHLTLMTFLWSALIILFGYLSVENIHWLWAFNLCIFFQHITDMLDGAVGRARNEGLVKWGFYMDHFLDYIFLCAVVIGYSFLLPSCYWALTLLCLTICGGFMVHFFLDFAITNEFKISYNQFGSSEIRYVLILFNIILIFAGKQILVCVFPAVVLILCAALGVIVYRSQKIYLDIDVKALKK